MFDDPKFGDVFEYGEGARIMYVAWARDKDFPNDWIGVTIRAGSAGRATFVGEIAQRVPLEGELFSHWRVADDA